MKTMDAIETFGTAILALFDRLEATITNLEADRKNLNDQIAAWKAVSGDITPGDQTMLDSIQARAKTIADRLDALHTLTPPIMTAPPAP